MNFFSLASFTVFLLSLFLALYVIRQDGRALINRLFILLASGNALWSLCYTFMYPIRDLGTAWLLYKLSAPAWCLMPGVLLHFVLLLTQRRPGLLPSVLIHLPGLVFLVRAWTGPLLVADFEFSSLGIIEIHNQGSLWYLGYMMLYPVMLGIAMTALIFWVRRTGETRHKRQAAAVVISAVLCFLFVGLFNLLLPAMGIQFPPIGTIFTFIYLFGAYMAVSRYKVLVVTPEIAVREILAKMMDLVVLLDESGRIVEVNEVVRDMLGLIPRELIGRPITALGFESESIQDSVKSEINGARGSVLTRTTLQSPRGQVPVAVMGSKLRDRYHDFVGYVYVIHDRTETIKLISEVEERKALETRLRNIAETDELTGVNNRRKFLQVLDQELLRTRRYKRPLTLLMLDLDHFKRINDSLGHSMGDLMLQTFARICQDNLRNNDIFGRLGGEEFAALLPETDMEQAERVAERIRNAVCNCPSSSTRDNLRLTVSIGVTAYKENDSAEVLLTRADTAMYKAKNLGRNRVELID